MNPDTLRTELETILNGVSTVAKVYTYRNPEPDEFPAVIFDTTDFESEMYSNRENLDTYTITFYVVLELAQTTSIKAGNAILDVVVKDVITALADQTNISLNGACDWIEPVRGAREEANSTGGRTLWQTLARKCHKATATI